MPDTELLSLLKEVELSGAIVSMAASCILPTFESCLAELSRGQRLHDTASPCALSAAAPGLMTCHLTHSACCGRTIGAAQRTVALLQHRAAKYQSLEGSVGSCI